MYKDIPTKIPGIKVHITGYDKRDQRGHIVLRGYPIDADGVQIDDSKRVTRIAKNDADIATTEQHIVAAAIKALPRKTVTRGEKKLLDDDHIMVRAFAELKDSNDLITPDWSTEVRDRRMSYFQGHILPRILQYTDEPFSAADRDEIYAQILADTEKHGNSKGNRQAIVVTVKNNLANAAIIYGAMRRVNPNLPLLELATPRVSRSIQQEQPKSLPQEVRHKFVRLLEQKVSTDPLYALATICMWDAGARTAEAAAVVPGDFAPIDNSLQLSLWVLYQEKKGKRSPILKSDAGYRHVPLSYWGTKMIERCLSAIQSWPEDKTIAPMRANDLSRWIKSQLVACGCDEVFWAAATKAELLSPDLDGSGKPYYDVVAYVLRKDRASRWRNVCGLIEQCDYLLGHAVYKAKKRKLNYAMDEEQAKIAACGERYVYNPHMCLHPACTPIQLAHGLDNTIIPYEAVTFANPGATALMLHLDISAAEAAEEIQMFLSNATEIEIEQMTIRHLHTHGHRENAPIIGTGQLKEGEIDDPLG